MESKSILKSALVALGIVTTGYVLTKSARWLFATCGVVGVLIGVHMFVQSHTAIKKMEHDQVLHYEKMITNEAREQRETADVAAQESKEVLRQELDSLRAQGAKSADTQQSNLDVQLADEELRNNITVYESNTYTGYNKLKAQYDAVKDKQEQEGDRDLDAHLARFRLMRDLDSRMVKALPNEQDVRDREREIRSVILQAYGLPWEIKLPFDEAKRDFRKSDTGVRPSPLAPQQSLTQNPQSYEVQITNLYHVYLHRDPERAGFDNWINEARQEHSITRVKQQIESSPEAARVRNGQPRPQFDIEVFKREGVHYW